MKMNPLRTKLQYIEDAGANSQNKILCIFLILKRKPQNIQNKN